MLIKTQTNQNEVEVGTSFVFNGQADSTSPVLNGLSKLTGKVKLETRMLVFDAMHGTDYRSIRHALIAEQKRRDFEKSIGLVFNGSVRKHLR